MVQAVLFFTITVPNNQTITDQLVEADVFNVANFESARIVHTSKKGNGDIDYIIAVFVTDDAAGTNDVVFSSKQVTVDLTDTTVGNLAADVTADRPNFFKLRSKSGNLATFDVLSIDFPT